MNRSMAFARIDGAAIVEGEFYLVRTADGLQHCATRVDGVWRYARHGQAVRGEVSHYVPASGKAQCPA